MISRARFTRSRNDKTLGFYWARKISKGNRYSNQPLRYAIHQQNIASGKVMITPQTSGNMKSASSPSDINSSQNIFLCIGELDTGSSSLTLLQEKDCNKLTKVQAFPRQSLGWLRWKPVAS